MTLTLQILKVKTSINLIPVSDSKKNTESENLVITISHFQYYQTIIFRLGGGNAASKCQKSSIYTSPFPRCFGYLQMDNKLSGYHMQGFLAWLDSSLVTMCNASQPSQSAPWLPYIGLLSLVRQFSGYYTWCFLTWLVSSHVTICSVSQAMTIVDFHK